MAARKVVHALQERLRLRWIEFYLCAHKPDAARALGWEPAAEHAAADSKGSPSSVADDLEAGALLIVRAWSTAVKGWRRRRRRPPPPPEAAPRRTALDFPRFLAALHISAYHLVAGVQPRDEMHNAIKWGFMWVPYFFVLSGFVSTLAQAGKDARGGGARFAYCGGDACAWLWKRLVGAYPLFVLSCLLARWNSGAHEWPAGKWASLAPTLLFLQTWAPDLSAPTPSPGARRSLEQPAWFVSASSSAGCLPARLPRDRAPGAAAPRRRPLPSSPSPSSMT